MKTAIIYYSQHHGNTKKLLDAIAAEYEVDLFDVTKDPLPDFGSYDRIGLASGVYYSQFAKQIIAAAEQIPKGMPIFFIGTCGASPKDSFLSGVKVACAGCPVLGSYLCNGYDTFGPFKVVGGIKKGHPTEEEVEGAVAFYGSL